MQVHPLDPTSTDPPFEQLRVQIATRAAGGDLPAGTRLPTVRALAAELGLAVNTVAKAYRALEADGVIVTEGRRGTFVSATAAGSSTDAAAAAAAYVADARRLGLTLAEAVHLVERGW
ncbi:GntR family transcriptional regulator [Nocardioides sp. Root1257]|uniref:GntR family transcriptional regulator n=1 Tax=unclassified Nocardioides TaxID=2615069 RepID=UPI0007004591|nr:MULTISPECIES: GntR family transcriptional regulator [unclassified Nocardioides]KQW48766.1 GntR family transcriptional regulator [Nocardioides sp. Root1257]KRC47941.1 GntR family transcriptional regulator [Nocardioides sp. Root224]